jgi:hypothetical protein
VDRDPPRLGKIELAYTFDISYRDRGFYTIIGNVEIPIVDINFFQRPLEEDRNDHEGNGQ